MGNDVGVPDWLLTIPRLLLTPLRWSVRKAQRWTTDRRALVKEGSTAVTPVVQLVKGLGPTSIMLGTDEQNAAYLKERHAEWQKLRGPLMTFGNHHPSDRVRSLVGELETAVNADMGDTTFLLSSRHSEYAHEAFKSSERSHEEAVTKGEELMKEIRRY
jgi:hypothetical protein